MKIEKKQSSKQRREEIKKQIVEKENLKLKESNQISRRSKRIKKTNPKYENAMSELKLKAQKDKGEKVIEKQPKQIIKDEDQKKTKNFQ